jgi:hypothetical protein
MTSERRVSGRWVVGGMAAFIVATLVFATVVQRRWSERMDELATAPSVFEDPREQALVQQAYDAWLDALPTAPDAVAAARAVRPHPTLDLLAALAVPGAPLDGIGPQPHSVAAGVLQDFEAGREDAEDALARLDALPPDVLILAAGARIAAQTGDGKDGVRRANEIALALPTRARPELLMAEAVRFDVKPDKKIHAYERATVLSPGSVEAWRLLGDHQRRMGRMGSAREAYAEVDRLGGDPGVGPVIVELLLGDVDAAQVAAARSARHGGAERAVELARVFADAGRWPDAVQYAPTPSVAGPCADLVVAEQAVDVDVARIRDRLFAAECESVELDGLRASVAGLVVLAEDAARRQDTAEVASLGARVAERWPAADPTDPLLVRLRAVGD